MRASIIARLGSGKTVAQVAQEMGIPWITVKGVYDKLAGGWRSVSKSQKRAALRRKAA